MVRQEWAAKDSNLRLPPCEDGTLTTELAARQNYLYMMNRDLASERQTLAGSPASPSVVDATSAAFAEGGMNFGTVTSERS